MGQARSGALVVLVLLATGLLLPLIVVALAVAVLARRPRIAVGMALGLLLLSAVGTVAGWHGLAEGLGVWSYSLLTVGVVLMLLRLRGGTENGDPGEI